MAEYKYSPLQIDQVPSSDDDRMLLSLPKQKKVLGKFEIPVVLLLLASVALNVILLSEVNSEPSLGPRSRTAYAGLVNDLDVAFVWNSEFSGENETEVNKLWYGDEQSDEGIIALDNLWAKAVGLPDSQPFTWDYKTKSTYITTGHHNLHCLRNIYISLDQFRHNIPQTLEWPHVLHCLDNLRSDIMCNADDTPLYTDKVGRPGIGQVRKCRDWSQLQEFVRAHSGCFRYIEPGNHTMKTIERIKYCSNDSPYLPMIRQYFGLPEEWLPWPEKVTHE